MPKNFRSSYATNRLRNGYTLADIRDQMGHRDIHSVETLSRINAQRRPSQKWKSGRWLGLIAVPVVANASVEAVMRPSRRENRLATRFLSSLLPLP
jgi:hypothetical protein